VWAEPIPSVDVLAHARSLRAAPGFVWLDSNRAEAHDGRYSFLSAWPSDRIRVDFGEPHPFAALRNARTPTRTVAAHGPVPSHVPSWIGYVAYDAFWSSPPRGERRLERARDPVLFFRRYPALVAIDHRTQQAWLVGDDARACEAFRKRLDSTAADRKPALRIGFIEADDAQSHKNAIERVRRYIELGDVYEVNIARRWSAAFEGDPFELWQAMRIASRVPLGVFLDADDHAVLGCTMERFIRWDARSRALVTRPIKGTIRRDPSDDGAPARLRADPKERAEHSMVVDLMRNDLGRVAEIGTVQVEQPLVVEPFSGLYHLVSTVSCLTRGDVGLEQILEATFPPGSVTGAPKIRAIEIIEELEQHPRGIYCGALGFIDRCGGLSLAVAIRTALIRAGRVSYWAGGGIVEASDPDREVAETELKARVFLDATESLRAGRCTPWHRS
jgi:para-aminobenzoate synthetase component 1